MKVSQQYISKIIESRGSAICISMFIVTLFTIHKDRNNPNLHQGMNGVSNTSLSSYNGHYKHFLV
jgi:hypothetical protein